MDIMPDFDLIDREYAYDGELGALYSEAQTTFRCMEPDGTESRAEAVSQRKGKSAAFRY